LSEQDSALDVLLEIDVAELLRADEYIVVVVVVVIITAAACRKVSNADVNVTTLLLLW
jgi:hypothetical protein